MLGATRSNVGVDGTTDIARPPNSMIKTPMAHGVIEATKAAAVSAPQIHI